MPKVKVTGAYVRVPGGVVMKGGVAEVEDADRLISLGVAEAVPNSTPVSPGVSTAPPIVTGATAQVDYSRVTAAAEATGAEGPPKSLEEQTVTELRATAKEQGIAIPAEVKKKDEILALLRGEDDDTPDGTEATGAEGSPE